MQTDWNRLRGNLFGTKAFYKAVLAIIIPVIIQNGVSNVVSMLDNLMVGALGNNEMSGVAVANQLIFIYNLCIFGGMSGVGIFTAQYHGAGDVHGVRYTFRIKVILSLILSLICVVIMYFFQDELLGLYLKGEADTNAADPVLILRYGKDYLNMLLISMPVSGIAVAYASTTRETGDAFWPMVASLAAVAVNLFGNWLLIFGNWGCPVLGVKGAAIATLVSRFVEMGINVLHTHACKRKYPFIAGAYRNFHVPSDLIVKVAKVGTPLLLNEMLWSIGMSLLNMVYSLCGLIVMGAMSINSTISNLFSVITYSMGTAVAVMVGQDLGAGQFDRAMKHTWQLVSFAFMLALATMGVTLLTYRSVTSLYSGVTDEIRNLAGTIICITGVALPVHAISHTCYFAIRSGGKTFVTFLFDCGFTLGVSVPIALLCVKGFQFGIIPTVIVVNAADILKSVIGFILVKKGVWIQNMAAKTQES